MPRQMSRRMKRTVKRLFVAIVFPLLSLLQYWIVLDDDYSTNKLLLASAIAIVVAAGIFLYAPIAKKVERGGLAWASGFTATVLLAAIGFMYMLDGTKAWGWPVFFFAIWVPVVHQLCQQLDVEVKLSFFKAPRKL